MTVLRNLLALGAWLAAFAFAWAVVSALIIGPDADFSLGLPWTGPIPGFAGFLATFALLYPAVLCVCVLASVFVYVFRRESVLPAAGAAAAPLSIIVPAHDEERTIGRTLESLLRGAGADLRIHVVSDGSADRTVKIARGLTDARITVHELERQGGKGAALACGLAAVDTDLFVVVDADTVAPPGSLGLLTSAFSDPRVGAVTASIRIGRTGGWLRRMQAMEYAGIIGLLKRAQHLWGGLFTVSGAAAAFRTAAVREAGGWAAHVCTEDIEISWRLQMRGWKLAYEPRAVFQVEAPATARALLRQRVRWARGLVEVLRIHGNVLRARNRALIPIFLEACADLAWTLAVLACLGAALFEVATTGRVPPFIHDAPEVLAWTLSLFLVQTTVGCTLDSHYEPGSKRLIPLALAYPLYYWCLVFPSCVVGGILGLLKRRIPAWMHAERGY